MTGRVISAGLWEKYPAPEVATIALKKDESLWGAADLSRLPGFEGAVRLDLDDLINKGAAATLAHATGARLVQ